MYLFALVMIVLNLAAFGVGIRVPLNRHPAGGTRHVRSLFRSSNSPRNASGTLRSATASCLAEALRECAIPDESPLICGFLKKLSFF